jgi:hypothetical protein
MNYNNNNNTNNMKELVTPVKSYKNSEEMKLEILDNNRDKSGIYRWLNYLNGNSYVGSAVNLKIRLRSYYNTKELKRNPRPIKDALLKYGHCNFTLDGILSCNKPYRKGTILYRFTNP